MFERGRQKEGCFANASYCCFEFISRRRRTQETERRFFLGVVLHDVVASASVVGGGCVVGCRCWGVSCRIQRLWKDCFLHELLLFNLSLACLLENRDEAILLFSARVSTIDFMVPMRAALHPFLSPPVTERIDENDAGGCSLMMIPECHAPYFLLPPHE